MHLFKASWQQPCIHLISCVLFFSVCAETENGCVFAGSALGKKGKATDNTFLHKILSSYM